MITIEQLKPGMIIRFKQDSNRTGDINPGWVLKKLEFINFSTYYGDPSISYKCKEHINSRFTTDNKIHNDILLSKLKYMEIVGERKSHLPKWW